MIPTRCPAAAALVAMLSLAAGAAALTPPTAPPSEPDPLPREPAPPIPPMPMPMPGDFPGGLPGAPGAPGAPGMPAGIPGMPDLPPIPTPPPAPMGHYMLSDLAFFAGRWRGTTDGSIVEEHWSAPEGRSMVGMFRWIAPGGAPYMFQLMTLTEEGGRVLMRVREFSPEMIAKEEKDKPKVLYLVEVKGERAEFAPGDASDGIARVIYERPSPDALTFTVTFPEDAKREPFTLTLAREGSTPAAPTPAAAPAEAPAAPAPTEGR